MGGDTAPDLVCGKGRSLLVCFGEDDREVRRAFRVEERDGVSVANRMPKSLRNFSEQAFELDLPELFVHVLGVVELDHEH